MDNFLASRLSSHGLEKPRFSSAKEVVEHFGCLQAQDIGQSLWVIGSRIKDASEDTMIKACQKGEIIRTWPMRGTLHYMAPNYVHMLIELCASNTLPGFKKRREFLGITDAMAEKALEIMEKNLRGGKSLTRIELTKVLEENGIPMQTQWTYHLACYAATRGLICFGAPTEKEETFVLLDEWVKKPKKLNREESLAELARMYYRGHGPATIHDLAWWAGMGITDSKAGTHSIEKELEKIERDGKTYYQYQPFQTGFTDENITFLGGFDEYFLGYKDRSPIADIEHHKKLFTSNGIFFPIILKGGRAIGVWKRAFKKDAVQFRIETLNGVKLKNSELKEECERYMKFTGYSKYEIL